MQKYHRVILILMLLLDAALLFAFRMNESILWLALLTGSLWFTLSALLRYGMNLLRQSHVKAGAVRLVAVLAGVVEILAMLYGAFYVAQDMALFYPSHDQESLVYLTSRPDFEAVEFSAAGKTWHGILRRNAAADEAAPLILFFCGNGQNASQAMRNMENNKVWPYFQDYSFLLMDYAGYGLNEGLPSAGNMCAEALAAFDYAQSLPEVSRIIAGGYSIGTGPAVYLAAHREVSGLFLLAPYANGYDLYNNVLPIFRGPLRLFVKHRFPSDRYAKDISAPVLIIASRTDEVVPFASSERLSACMSGETTFVALSGVGHNSIFFNRTALESVREYLENAIDY